MTVAEANGTLRKNRRSTKARGATVAQESRERQRGGDGDRSDTRIRPAQRRLDEHAHQPEQRRQGQQLADRVDAAHGDRAASGTNSAVSTMAALQIGRLIQKTDRQPTSSISMPPTIGPSAIEMPTTPPQMPSARARSTLPTNTREIIDSATGFIIEPPIP